MSSLLSKSVLKQSVKNNWKLWAVLTGVMCFFIVVITIAMNSTIGRMEGGMPGGMRDISMDTMLAQIFFGASGMGVMLMLIYSIAVGNKLVASEVDRGTMSFTLNTPTTRKQIIFSKAFFYILSIVLMIVLIGISGTIASIAAGATINVGNLWLVILGCLLFGFAISGICFFASCWFNKSGQSLMIGAGLPVAFFLLSSLSPIVKISDTEFLKYFSLNTLFDTSAILSGGGFIVQFIVLFAIGFVLYFVGINKFLKKDLPL